MKNFKQCRQEIDRNIAEARAKGIKYVVKMQMLISNDTATQIKKYYEQEFSHRVEIEKCLSCGSKWDIVIFIQG